MASKRKHPAQRGFTMAEVILSMTVWGLMMVPFVAFYGQMQRTFYTTQRQAIMLNSTRLTMDKVRQDLHRVGNPADAIGGTPSTNSLCFAYTPLDSSGNPQSTESHMWYQSVASPTTDDPGRKVLMAKTGTSAGGTTLASFCTSFTGAQPVSAAGADSFVQDMQFQYYNDLGATVTPTLSPLNFSRVAASVTFGQPLTQTEITSTTTVAPRALAPTVTGVEGLAATMTLNAKVDPAASGQATTLQALVRLSDGAYDGNGVTWTTTDSNVISLGASTYNASTGYNLVTATALNHGFATITATSVRDPSRSQSINITVTTYATAVTFSGTTLTARVSPANNGSSATLAADVTYADGTHGSAVSWSSANTTVATINSISGLVTGVQHGYSTITATTTTPNTSIIGSSTSANAVVTVTTYAIGVSLSPNTATLTGKTGSNTYGASTTLSPTVSYADGTTSSAVSWASSNTAVADVSAGTVSAKQHGFVTITATSTKPDTSIVDPVAAGTAAITVTTFATAVIPGNVTVTARTCSSCTNGSTTTPTVTVFYADGTSGSAVSWASASTGVATINSVTGLVTGVTHGTSTLTATSTQPDTSIVAPAVSNTSTATVTTTAASVVLSPASSTLTARVGTSGNGQTTTITPTVTYTDGTTSTAASAVSWGSSNLASAAVSSGGVVTALVHGTATITATSVTGATIIGATQQGTSAITVTTYATGVTLSTPATTLLGRVAPAATGGTSDWDATVAYADGTSGAGAASWAANNTSVATVNSSTGVVTAVNHGMTSITATSTNSATIVAPTQSASATVTVTTYTLNVSLNPNSLTLTARVGSSGNGQTQTITATANYADGTTGTMVTWSASNTAVADVNSAGTVTAKQHGTASVRATSITSATIMAPTQFADAAVTVTTYVSSVSVSPTTATLTARVGSSGNGQTTTLAASINYADGTSSTTAVDWTTSNASAASVSSAGLVTAFTHGTATITATTTTSSTIVTPVKTATAAITVTTYATSVTLNPTSTTLTARVGSSGSGSTTTIAATVAYADGTSSAANVNWSSGNSGIATVNTSGLVTGITHGVVSITATSTTPDATLVGSTQGATASVTVTTTVSSVSLTPTTATLTARVGSSGSGQTTTLAATVNYGDGTSSTVAVNWSTSNASVAGVGSTGTVTAYAHGTATVTAASNMGPTVVAPAKSATTAITVTTYASNVSVSPTSTTLTGKTGSNTYGQTTTATATVNYADGTSSSSAFGWSSNNTAAAEVNAAGTISAKQHGTATITATSTLPDATVVGSMVSGSATVTVTTYPLAFSLSPAAANIPPGGTVTLSAPVTHADGTTGSASWACVAGCSFASVNGSGVVTGVSSGTATIRATSNLSSPTIVGPATSADATVTVQSSVSSVTVSPATATVYTAGTRRTATFTATVQMGDGSTNSNVTWSCVSGCGYISQSGGTVTGVSAGTAVIRATANQDSSKYVQATVYVANLQATSITLTTSNLGTLTWWYDDRAPGSVGAYVNLNDGTTETDLSWSSNNTGVAVVSGSSLSGGYLYTSVYGRGDGGCSSVRATSSRTSSVYTDVSVCSTLQVIGIERTTSNLGTLTWWYDDRAPGSVGARVQLSNNTYETNVTWDFWPGYSTSAVALGTPSDSGGYRYVNVYGRSDGGCTYARAYSNRNSGYVTWTYVCSTLQVIGIERTTSNLGTLTWWYDDRAPGSVGARVQLSNNTYETNVTWDFWPGYSTSTVALGSPWDSGGYRYVNAYGRSDGSCTYARAYSNRNTGYVTWTYVCSGLSVTSLNVDTSNLNETWDSSATTISASVSLSNNTTEYNIDWWSDNTGYVTVTDRDQYGDISGVNDGNCTYIRIRANRSGTTSAKYVCSILGVNSVSVSPTSATIYRNIYNAYSIWVCDYWRWRRYYYSCYASHYNNYPTTYSYDTTSLSATVNLTNGTTETGVTWSSSDTSVATVNTSGTVTAVIKGTSTITATSTRNTSQSGTSAITVCDRTYNAVIRWYSYGYGAGYYYFSYWSLASTSCP